MTSRRKVVVIGAGFAGMAVVRDHKRWPIRRTFVIALVKTSLFVEHAPATAN